jgi:hypothetical protein
MHFQILDALRSGDYTDRRDEIRALALFAFRNNAVKKNQMEVELWHHSPEQSAKSGFRSLAKSGDRESTDGPSDQLPFFAGTAGRLHPKS